MMEKQNIANNLEIVSNRRKIDNLDELNFISQNPVTQEFDGIEILVAMAKQGKIDPWNIDIVDITDKYLAKMIEMKAQNLKITGRTLLFAAILLKIKSNVLEGFDLESIENIEEENYFEEDFDINDDMEEDYLPTNNVVSIDEVLQRRTSVRLNRNRVVTLRDLIRQLEFYEMLEKKQSLKNAHERAKRRVRSYANLSPEEIVNLAHEEYIEQGVETLKANLDQILNQNEKVELNELTLLGMDRITAYISLLFLCAESNYELVQDNFYEEVYVKKSHEMHIEEIA